jgi:hypothetical protein
VFDPLLSPRDARRAGRQLEASTTAGAVSHRAYAQGSRRRRRTSVRRVISSATRALRNKEPGSFRVERAAGRQAAGGKRRARRGGALPAFAQRVPSESETTTPGPRARQQRLVRVWVRRLTMHACPWALMMPCRGHAASGSRALVSSLEAGKGKGGSYVCVTGSSRLQPRRRRRPLR